MDEETLIGRRWGQIDAGSVIVYESLHAFSKLEDVYPVLALEGLYNLGVDIWVLCGGRGGWSIGFGQAGSGLERWARQSRH